MTISFGFLIEREKMRLIDLKSRRYPDEYDIEDTCRKIELLKKFSSEVERNELYQKMMHIVERVVKHYHLDFYFYDLDALTNYEGRFAWFVGRTGTHLIRLDVKTEEHKYMQIKHLKAVINQYPKNEAYFVDPKKSIFKRLKDISLSADLVEIIND